MKRIIYLSFIIFGMPLFGMNFSDSNEDIMNEISNSLPENLYIIDSVYGYFISDSELSLIVLCDQTVNKKANKNVSNIYLYEIFNNRPKLWGELKFSCAYLNYEESVNSFYESIGLKQDLSMLGKSYKFGWAGDFNNNGYTELMLLQSAYSEEGVTLEFIEFNKYSNKFEVTLPAQDAITYIAEADEKKYSMKLERSKYSALIDNYEMKKTEIVWNAKLFKYIEQ